MHIQGRGEKMNDSMAKGTINKSVESNSLRESTLDKLTYCPLPNSNQLNRIIRPLECEEQQWATAQPTKHPNQHPTQLNELNTSLTTYHTTFMFHRPNF
mmetsp:Transcript_2091/g.2284  ORF Transcript_2091/g.2284 Transcript_2091/m.2284 type:complete len:99 (-) Transcript_2091:460-756(-)